MYFPVASVASFLMGVLLATTICLCYLYASRRSSKKAHKYLARASHPAFTSNTTKPDDAFVNPNSTQLQSHPESYLNSTPSTAHPACHYTAHVAQPQPVSHSTAQPVPHSIAQSVPHSIVQSVPHSIAQSVPHSVAQSVPRSVAQSVPHSIVQSVPHSTHPPSITRPKKGTGYVNVVPLQANVAYGARKKNTSV